MYGYIDVRLITKDKAIEIAWSIGSCKSNGGYTNDETFNQKCCLAAGNHKITCKDSYGDGWNGAHLEIHGVKYCDEFTAGGVEEEDLTIGGNHSLQPRYNCIPISNIVNIKLSLTRLMDKCLSNAYLNRVLCLFSNQRMGDNEVRRTLCR